MAKTLVVVESPAKARTIARFLGSGYVVESSLGHIRDLPSSAAEIPARFRKAKWSRLGVDVENDFAPIYVIPKSKAKHVKKLQQRLKDASELFLATDEDREGEAIAWHLVDTLKPSCPVKRMVFHEITRAAIEHALAEPRDVDLRLVNAQEARRILDRLVGYEVSPLLWRKIAPKLSAGRVQSVAVRLVVDRERERINFHAANYCGLEARLRPHEGGAEFTARLTELGGQKIATGKDFADATGKVKDPQLRVLDTEAATRLAGELAGAPFTVAEVNEKPFTSRPYPPFMTSTLQQEAARKLRYSAQRTMRLAQGLYENGYITYMRTDSVALSGEAIRAARSQVAHLYGDQFLPERPRHYTSRAKNAQEAHEAIRPAGESFRTPQELANTLAADELRLYELIWKRTLASQMKDASGLRTNVRIEAPSASFGPASLSASGRVLTFPGFLRAYVEGSDDPAAELADQEKVLPPLRPGQALDPIAVEPTEHTTQPLARHTEASLVRELETRGIGRPSTYAAILETIQDRGYVYHRGQALVPTYMAFAVTQLLERHLSELVDYEFTARMENDLDAIARGERETVPWLREFYFGPAKHAEENGRLVELGLQELLAKSGEQIAPQDVARITLPGEVDGKPLVVRVGRYGPYLELGEGAQGRLSVPEDLPPDELTPSKVRELQQRTSNGSRDLGADASGTAVLLRTGRFGPYVQLGTAEAGKPRMASLWPDMKPESLTLEQALKLLEYPRELGRHPESGEPVIAHYGRFGPFLKMGEETRSLADYAALETVTLEQAVELFRAPKPRRRRAGTSALAELGARPDTGAAVVVKDGRFGPYVTDGTLNATLPKGTAPTELTLERALELLAARERKLREQGLEPGQRPPRRGRGRRTAKRAPRG